MREARHALSAIGFAVGALTLATLSPPSIVDARSEGGEVLPRCLPDAVGGLDEPASGRPSWRAVLDERGWLVGHEFSVFADARHITLHLGASAFADGPFGGTWIVGERRAGRTVMRVVGADAACLVAERTVPGLVFGTTLDRPLRTLYYSAVDGATRRELGLWRVPVSTGGPPERIMAPAFGALSGDTPRSVRLAWTKAGLASTWCLREACSLVRAGAGGAIRDGGAVLAQPQVDSGTSGQQPVPLNGDDRWPQDADLPYRWNPAETPPSWMRPAINDAADDVAGSKRSQAVTFHLDPDATDGFRYTESFPGGGCEGAIACATRNVPYSWTIRFRVQGYDFRWGPMRWCQADPRDGCFDVERIALHELGHIEGLDHPEAGGFSLPPLATVMHSTSPSRPQTGSGMHAFGPCDTATLQERYDLTSWGAHISTCNDVISVLSLAASATTIGNRDPVTFIATLQVSDRDGYGRLRNDPLSGRSVQLRRRAAGSSDAWTVFWMASGPGAGTYSITLQPSATYEYLAAFPAPDDEGLRGATSNLVTVRATGACGLPPCPESTFPLAN